MASPFRKNTRLSGHTLRCEGAAFVWKNDRYIRTGEWRGKGMCSCGATSDVLESNNAPKRWHAAHKDAIRQAGGSRA